MTTLPAVSHARADGPLGPLLIRATTDAIVGIDFVDDARGEPGAPSAGATRWLDVARRQLDEYFAGERRRFDLPLAPAGSAFQRAVWAELLRLEFGETSSYRDLARRVGRPTASRAVGAANGRNPIAIVVPCHRVIGSDGSLTGYAGGLSRKRWLLAHERDAITTRDPPIRGVPRSAPMP